MKYLILSPGRTGSMMLFNIIANGYNLQSVHLHQDSDIIDGTIINNVVIHSHSTYFSNRSSSIPIEDMTLIISKRRNTFDAAMSRIIAMRTKENVSYQRRIAPFYEDLKTFRRTYAHYFWFYNSINLSLPYRDIVTIYYEDIIDQGVKVVEQQLKVPFLTVPTINTQKNINNYKDVVRNYKELYQAYLEYEKNIHSFRFELNRYPFG